MSNSLSLQIEGCRLQKLLNTLVIVFWVLAQTMTAANSSVHMTPGSQSQLHHSPHHEMTGHGMHSDAAAPAGHDQSGYAMPCPASGANKAPDGSSDGNCCDQANCHVVDLVLNQVQLGSRHVEIFGIAAQRSHVVWAPASPFPPPNNQF
jgi:hypothetical protein